MTEREWLECTDPRPMLEFLQGKASDRKLRLYACACCRRIWQVLTDERSRKAVEIAELFADGTATEAELEDARNEAHCAFHPFPECDVRNATLWAACFVADMPTSFAAQQVTALICEEASNEMSPERPGLGGLLHEILGNPFQSIYLDQTCLNWNGATIPKLARGIYDERAFARLPALADALEQAGCHDADILNHCRMPGEHFRGCWVLDLVLGKE